MVQHQRIPLLGCPPSRKIITFTLNDDHTKKIEEEDNVLLQDVHRPSGGAGNKNPSCKGPHPFLFGWGLWDSKSGTANFQKTTYYGAADTLLPHAVAQLLGYTHIAECLHPVNDQFWWHFGKLGLDGNAYMCLHHAHLKCWG